MSLFAKVCLAVFLFMISLSLGGCVMSEPQESKETKIASKLPSQAANVKNLGNQWFTFELDGKKFMFRDYGNSISFLVRAD